MYISLPLASYRRHVHSFDDDRDLTNNKKIANARRPLCLRYNTDRYIPYFAINLEISAALLLFSRSGNEELGVRDIREEKGGVGTDVERRVQRGKRGLQTWKSTARVLGDGCNTRAPGVCRRHTDGG